jgi:hypothetical protein
MSQDQSKAQEREAFEAWHGGIYSGLQRGIALAAWQARAALAPAPSATPAGWRLVPIEPTPEMLKSVDGEAEDKYLARGRALSAWRSMLAEAPQPALAADAVPVAWRPIETAPKNGPEILLSNGSSVSQGYWLHREGGITECRDEQGRHQGQIDDDGFIGWFDYDGGMDPGPSHWMPLPPPPSAAPQPATVAAGEVVVTTDSTGRCVAVTRQDDDHRVLSVIWQAKPAPTAQAGVMSSEDIRSWWLSENGLEDCVMSKFGDFEMVVRAVEERQRAAIARHTGEGGAT